MESMYNIQKMRSTKRIRGRYRRGAGKVGGRRVERGGGVESESGEGKGRGSEGVKLRG